MSRYPQATMALMPETLIEKLKRERREKIEMETLGVAALKRLLPIAQGHSGQCKIVAAFLLGLYNGTRFPFDMTDFRILDTKIFDDCMTVLQMDRRPLQEVHCYFPDGGRVWEQLARDWGIKNRPLAE